MVREFRRKHLNWMWINLAIAVLGIVLSLAFYTAASQSGGVTIVFWGAVVFGLIGFVRSAYRASRSKRQVWIASVVWSSELRRKLSPQDQ